MCLKKKKKKEMMIQQVLDRRHIPNHGRSQDEWMWMRIRKNLKSYFATLT
jgi:hypothetical protein